MIKLFINSFFKKMFLKLLFFIFMLRSHTLLLLQRELSVKALCFVFSVEIQYILLNSSRIKQRFISSDGNENNFILSEN